jgi:hypothetical protein
VSLQIVINQAAKPPGVPGQAREDLVTGTAVSVAAVGGPFLAYSWTFIAKAINITAGLRATSLFATPAASSSLINPVDQTGTYLIQLAVDSGSGLGATEADVATITFYAGPALNANPALLPRRIPAFRERLQHNVPDAIDAAGNQEGWSREELRWYAYITAPGFGAQGAQGFQGATGAQGSQGTSGAQGSQGFQGALAIPALIVHGNTGATETFDFTAGPNHKATFDAACTVTLTAPAVARHLTIEFAFSGGSHVITWPAAVKFQNNVEPTWDAAKLNVVSLFWDSDASIYLVTGTLPFN